MRKGTDPSSTGDDDFLFSAPAATTPSHPKPTASSSSASLTSPVMSPDDMLRAYAERKAAGANKGFGRGTSTAQISYPVPAANTSTSSGSGGMRTLYNASGVVSPTNTGNGEGYTNGGYDAYGGGDSNAIGDEHDEGNMRHDPYGGTARMNECERGRRAEFWIFMSHPHFGCPRLRTNERTPSIELPATSP